MFVRTSLYGIFQFSLCFNQDLLLIGDESTLLGWNRKKFRQCLSVGPNAYLGATRIIEFLESGRSRSAQLGNERERDSERERGDRKPKEDHYQKSHYKRDAVC